MTSQEKTLAVCLTIILAFILAFWALKQNSQERIMQNIQEQKLINWKLKARIEEAKAEQAKYRAIELGFACELVDADGNVYGNGEC